LRLDPDAPPPSGLDVLLGQWRGARIAPTGEISLPIEGEARLEPLLELLRTLAVPPD